MPAGEATSAGDGSFELLLAREFVDAAQSRHSWGWSVRLHVEYPDCFEPIVTPSAIDSWDELANVTIAFPVFTSKDLEELKTRLEGLRVKSARKRARYGLEPDGWGRLQKLFDSVSEAVGASRRARDLVRKYEKDEDPHLRALAYEALGLHAASEDDADRPQGAGDGVSAITALEWCYRDVERSKHGGHYDRNADLDDGCMRCYSRWEEADCGLRLLNRTEALAFLARKKSLTGQAGVFHALLEEEFHRASRDDRDSSEAREFLPDFTFRTSFKAGESPLVFQSRYRTEGVGTKPLDVPVPLTPEGFLLHEYAWSPDGTRLAGRGGYDGGKPYEIWILDFEIGRASRATWGGTIDWRPTWFPDGRRLLFARNNAKGQDLLELDATTFIAKKLEGADDFLDHYSVHPAGNRVAVDYRQGVAQILDFGTGGLAPVVADGGPARMPAWSPTGSLITFLREESLYGVEPGGPRPFRLSPDGLKVARHAWSPNGAWIAFSYFQNQERDSGGIAVVSPDGKAFRELRAFRGWPGEDVPTWAPDSQRVAFGGRKSGGMLGELWIHSIENTFIFKLIPGSAGYAAWRPLR